MNARLLQAVTAVALVAFGSVIGVYAFPHSSEAHETLSIVTAPVHVPANTKPVNLKEGKMNTVEVSKEFVVPEDGWVTTFKLHVTGAPESSLRYGWLMDASQSDPYCTTTAARVVFVMSLEKTAGEKFPQGYGYFVKRGTKLRVQGGFANLTDKDIADASMNVALDFIPSSSGQAIGNAYPLFLNAECDSLFILPPKARNFTKRLGHPFVIPMDGRIVLIGSHAHDFVTEMLLTLNGAELWKTTAIHSPTGTNYGNPVYVAPYNGVPVKKGDVLDLVQRSTNQKDGPAAAMSSMYIHILPTGTTTSPDTGGMMHM